MFRISINEMTFSCGPKVNVLQVARTQMVKVPYGCANGGCGMCKVKVKDGAYLLDTYSKQALTNEEREDHYVLLCKTYPQSDIEIELIKEKVIE
ncbi:2Fe-2S iron-sulfur cluster-binding protein [Neobacillus cucumis]|uniref:2Fe-2S iron-sulfur cluster-binding protein n=1 Tax=Neobacillus cucumis TaxID=1740721 RepID=UPI0028535020|nr:2Fe-2S iron-sulfur cluster binding domain-containing protein [Neobacillus cucumis]MDR4945734.1 2Fe-2S iron-sulfur cluster binding domain-containing protein [Neobacillus cucumis]